MPTVLTLQQTSQVATPGEICISTYRGNHERLEGREAWQTVQGEGYPPPRVLVSLTILDR